MIQNENPTLAGLGGASSGIAGSSLEGWYSIHGGTASLTGNGQIVQDRTIGQSYAISPAGDKSQAETQKLRVKAGGGTAQSRRVSAGRRGQIVLHIAVQPWTHWRSFTVYFDGGRYALRTLAFYSDLPSFGMTETLDCEARRSGPTAPQRRHSSTSILITGRPYRARHTARDLGR